MNTSSTPTWDKYTGSNNSFEPQGYAPYMGNSLPENTPDMDKPGDTKWYNSAFGALGTIGSAWMLTQVGKTQAEQDAEKAKVRATIAAVVGAALLIALFIYLKTRK